MDGRIKIHRKIIEWERFDDSKILQFFLYCLARANIEDTTWHWIDIPRWSFVTSLDKISKSLSITIQNTRTILTKLKSTHEITSKSTQKYTVITVCKWDDYQSEQKKSTQQSTNRLTSNQQTINKQLTTDKKNKEEKEEKEINIVWMDFEKMRSKIKKPITERGKQMIFKKLWDLSTSESIQIKILEQSILHCRQDVYPLKTEQTDQWTIDKEKLQSDYAKFKEKKYWKTFTSSLLANAENPI